MSYCVGETLPHFGMPPFSQSFQLNAGCGHLNLMILTTCGKKGAGWCRGIFGFFWLRFRIFVGLLSWYHLPCICTSLKLESVILHCTVFATFWHGHFAFCMIFAIFGHVCLPFCMVFATFWHFNLSFAWICYILVHTSNVHVGFLRVSLGFHLGFHLGLL